MSVLRPAIALLLVYTPLAMANTPILQSDCQLTNSIAITPPSLRGMATWLAWQDDGSGMQASSEKELTAASSVLPSPSCALVENLTNHRRVAVLIDEKSPSGSFGLLQLGSGAARALDIFAATPIEVTGLAAAADASVPELPVTSDQHYLWSAAYSSARVAQVLWEKMQRAGIAKTQIAPGIDHGSWAYRLRLGPLPSNLSPSILAQTLRHAGFPFHTSENE
ncbi:hypothetical protein [Acidithiobacillus sp. AMEEHan]|uniref:hypothetical protein n=1 Tax=Acidithiobacillus sp. AMEEHan TaxID=2994951 RepID=UPI0027E40816|nr:hypothetical protein [Acidithiobacillus sp. AMEEHan]